MFIICTVYFLWVVRELKKAIFWLYLWQLKEYHIGRFLSHFKTQNGKSLILNPWLGLKYLLFFIFIFSILGVFSFFSFFQISVFILGMYVLEGLYSIVVFFKGKAVSPVATKKIAFLSISSSFLIVGYVVSLFFFFTDFTTQTLYLLAFDILTPLIVSFIVLILQPVTVFERNKVIKRATEKREQYPDLLSIGITGSFGKTSTKEFLSTILSKNFKVLKTEKHQNSEMGISRCILNNLDERYDLFVCEMGAYNRGGIKLLSSIAKPSIGIITGINNQHLDTFGSQEKIVETKFELIDSLPYNSGTAILNWDNKLVRDGYHLAMDSVKYSSANKEADLWAEDIVVEKNFLSFKACCKDGDSAQFKVNVLGKHNISNLLAAIGAAKKIGMSMENIAWGAGKIEPWQSGMKHYFGINNLEVIDASYSANYTGVMAHLDYLETLPGDKTIVMLPLIELGKEAKKVHLEIAKRIGEVCGLAVILRKDYFKDMKKEAVKAGIREENFVLLKKPEEMFKKIMDFSYYQQGTILLESRVPEELKKMFLE